MSYRSEVEDQVVAAAKEFCRQCDHLDKSREFPHRVGDVGKECNIFFMVGMIKRHQVGSCALAMVDGVSGTMTLEGFEPEKTGEEGTP